MFPGDRDPAHRAMPSVRRPYEPLTKSGYPSILMG